MTATPPATVRLLISCPDRPGIVAAVSRFLFERGANVLDADQHTTDPDGGTFFMRMVFRLPPDGVDPAALEPAFQDQVAVPFAMRWRVSRSDRRKRMALLVSKVDHCLLEVLWRWRAGELAADLPLVISNHAVLEPLVNSFGIPFHHLPVAAGRRDEQEARLLALLSEARVDTVVLARYMQILSPRVVARYPEAIVNIHHSFLPAFVGANPYRRAFDRGVKLIGATAHYVTDDLDEGPILEQEVLRVSHRETLPDLVRLGREVERLVLARALRAHLDDRVLVFGNKTVVFDG